MMFGTGPKRAYLDWAASAPVSRDALRAFEEAAKLQGNPSSPHADGVAARVLLDEWRGKIAKLAEVRRDGVVFTSGATEANSLALMGRVMKLREKGERDIHLLYLPSTHASVIETVRALEAQGVIAESLRIRDGAIDLEALDAQLRPETRMVVLDAICGETGTVYDTRGVRNVLEAHAKRTGASRSHLHVDASQTPLARPFDLTRLAADSVALDAQKVGGVRGAGALCMRSNIELAPIMHGGGQERGLRPGTEPVALMAAFARALETATQERESFVARAALARQRLVARMSATISNVLVNQGREGVPHILNVSLPGRDTDYLVMLLDKSGFSVATKSACETDSEQGSRAVLALTDDEERARSTLRISWGPTTRERDLERFADALISAVRFLDAAAGKRT